MQFRIRDYLWICLKVTFDSINRKLRLIKDLQYHKKILGSLLDLWQTKYDDRFANRNNLVNDLFKRVDDDISKSEAMYNIIHDLTVNLKHKKHTKSTTI